MRPWAGTCWLQTALLPAAVAVAAAAGVAAGVAAAAAAGSSWSTAAVLPPSAGTGRKAAVATAAVAVAAAAAAGSHSSPRLAGLPGLQRQPAVPNWLHPYWVHREQLQRVWGSSRPAPGWIPDQLLPAEVDT